MFVDRNIEVTRAAGQQKDDESDEMTTLDDGWAVIALTSTSTYEFVKQVKIATSKLTNNGAKVPPAKIVWCIDTQLW